MNGKKESTRAKIKQAYIELLKEKDPRCINVSLLCREVKINRSTFYEHFPYIELLIEEVIKDQLSSISRVNDELLDEYHFNRHTGEKEVERYLKNFASNQTLLKLCRSSEANKYKVLIANLSIRYELTKYHIQDPQEKIDIIYRNYGVFAIIFGWLEKTIGMSVEEVSRLLYQEIIKGDN